MFLRQDKDFRFILRNTYGKWNHRFILLPIILIFFTNTGPYNQIKKTYYVLMFDDVFFWCK